MTDNVQLHCTLGLTSKERLYLPVNAACDLFQSMLISEIMHSKAL